MRISAPWNFKSQNYNIKILLYKEKKICIPEIGCKNVDEILITISKVISSLNEIDDIHYTEFLFKYKIRMNNQFYYYPLKVFVDDEHSIIRGYYLGFNKEFSYFSFDENNIGIQNKHLNLNLEFKVLNKQIILEESYPFILSRNRSFSCDNAVDDIVTLDVYNYKSTKALKIEFSKKSIEDLLMVLNISRSDISQLSSYYFDDEFLLKGVKKYDI